MDLRFVWQAWHLRHWAGSGDGLGRGWPRVTPRLFCVAGVALGDICLRFVWQAWQLVTSAFVLCVALGDMDLRFAWQAWHLRHWAGSGDGLGRGWSRVTPRLFCVAGVALGDISLRFVWQAWPLATWTFALCGRSGTYGTGLALHGDGLGRGWSRVTPRLFAWQGVALGDICLCFVWQAWRLVTSAFVLCGMCGTYGTGLALVTALVAADAAPLCVAGVALGDICLRFVWQAWRLATWTFDDAAADDDDDGGDDDDDDDEDGIEENEDHDNDNDDDNGGLKNYDHDDDDDKDDDENEDDDEDDEEEDDDDDIDVDDDADVDHDADDKGGAEKKGDDDNADDNDNGVQKNDDNDVL
eukprot:s3867_g10.t1